jgi:hypothetical protein
MKLCVEIAKIPIRAKNEDHDRRLRTRGMHEQTDRILANYVLRAVQQQVLIPRIRPF